MATNFIKQVFQIIGILVISWILWGVIFGAVGRTFMWSAIEPVMQQQWSQCTLQDGVVVSDMFSTVFDEAPEYKITP